MKALILQKAVNMQDHIMGTAYLIRKLQGFPTTIFLQLQRTMHFFQVLSLGIHQQKQNQILRMADRDRIREAVSFLLQQRPHSS